MTNKVESIVAEITARLLASTPIKGVIRFPEHYQNIGNRYPLAVIREKRQDCELTSGQLYQYTLTIDIVLVSDVIRNRMQYMNNLQVSVFNAILADAQLGGLCISINPVVVDMGGLIRGSDIDAYAGFTDTNSFRQITLQCLVLDTRLEGTL